MAYKEEYLSSTCFPYVSSLGANYFSIHVDVCLVKRFVNYSYIGEICFRSVGDVSKYQPYAHVKFTHGKDTVDPEIFVRT